MGGTVRIRFSTDLWWSEIPYNNFINKILEVTYLSNDTCFVDVIDGLNRTHVELHYDDYIKISDNSAFNFNYNIKKHIV
jgi:hypothetical protein